MTDVPHEIQYEMAVDEADINASNIGFIDYYPFSRPCNMFTPEEPSSVEKSASRSPRRSSIPKNGFRSLKHLSTQCPERRELMSTWAFGHPSTFAHKCAEHSKTAMDNNHAHGKPDPIRHNTFHLMKLRNIRKFEREEHEEKQAKLKRNCGILWRKPNVLENIRMYWRFKDEMESTGENPGDNEMRPGTPIARKKKKLLTIKERMTRAIARKQGQEEQKNDALRRRYCQRNLKAFIENAKNGVSTGPISSAMAQNSLNGRSATSSFRFQFFDRMRNVFVRDNRRETKKVDFHVRADINRRLANNKLERAVRIAYEVIMENYESVLGPHLFYLFTLKRHKRFEELERAFLLSN